MFYRGLIEQALPTGWDVKLLKSGNRDTVLQTLASFDWVQYPRESICFFIDRDLADLTGEIIPADNNLYITDGYSLENELAQFGTFRRILEEVLGIADATVEEVESIQALFNANLDTFSDALCPIMAQILLWRRAGERAMLNDIVLKEFFEFEKGSIRLKKEFEDPIIRVRRAAEQLKLQSADETILRTAEIEFRTLNPTFKYVRGKYILWFVVETALRLHKIVGDLCANHASPPKIKVSLGFANAIVVIAPRVRCPESLRQFLLTNYLSYVTQQLAQQTRRAHPSRQSFWKAVLRWCARPLQ